MANWGSIRVKVNANDFDYVRTKIEGFPDEVSKELIEPAIRKIAAEGAEMIRQLVETDKNTRKYEETGIEGRMDTKLMRNSVRYYYRNRKKNGFSLFVGWERGLPGYAIFQEQGTKAGVRALNSIPQAQEFMLSELRKLASGNYRGSYRTFTGGM